MDAGLKSMNLADVASQQLMLVRFSNSIFWCSDEPRKTELMPTARIFKNEQCKEDSLSMRMSSMLGQMKSKRVFTSAGVRLVACFLTDPPSAVMLRAHSTTSSYKAE